ncbi:MAG TPA: flagellar basal-body MS-ring/collar protein FliF [Solimonas sp.]
MAELTLPSPARSLKDIPALRQLIMLVGVAVAVAAGFTVFNWSQKPDLAPLYGNLADKDAAEIGEALRAAKIPFQVDTASGAVSVPAAQVHEARLKLASQGLPRGSAQGFELIQQEQGFGTSQFIETARYQHALETELARSVSTLQPVRAARVHLALPKASAFARNREAASASVLVELHSGRTLEPDQVASIVHMVASSVSNLQPSAVTVVDQNGRLLTRDDGGSPLGQSSEQFEYARRVEADYVRRIEQLLTPMLGAGRVSAQVTADLDFSVTEEARETYKPDSATVRSEQTSEEQQRSPSGPAAGIPGATSNQPPPQTANPPLNQLSGANGSADAPLSQSKQSTRSYEIDRTLSHTRQPVGSVRRLSVAVLVDYVPRVGADKKVTMVALGKPELDKVNALVREAVGFSDQRGDSLSVQNAAFVQPDAVTPDELPIWQNPQMRDGLRHVGGALIVLALIFAVLRPVLKQLLAAPLAPRAAQGALPAGAGVSGMVADDVRVVSDGPVALGRGPGGTAVAALPDPYDEKLQTARSAVNQDPKRVAQVVKNWIGQE